MRDQLKTAVHNKMNRIENQIKDKHALIHYQNIPRLCRVSPYKMSELHDLMSSFPAYYKVQNMEPEK